MDWREMRARLNDLPLDVYEDLIEDPMVLAFIEMTSCEESHDGEHHFPFHVQKEVEREDCIECGKTKQEIQATFLGRLRRMQPSRHKARSSSVPKPGKFPGFGEEAFPKPG